MEDKLITQPKNKIKRQLKDKISDDDFDIIRILHSLKEELDQLHNQLNSVTDPLLIDSFIYETKAIHMKYNYYLNLCKKRGLIASGF